MEYEVAIACGRLQLRTIREDLPLPQLLDFASRQNPRRGFLFVSRVLGKHIPCSPATMRRTYRRLARHIGPVPGPVLGIGLAETATGLGAGVADSLARDQGRDDVLFQHTTRHRLDASTLLEFDEVHSHAPEHILYAPWPDLVERYRDSATLLLIDDEITTGRTLKRLAEQLVGHLPWLRELIFVSLVDWLGDTQRTRIARDLPVETRFVSLVSGTFSFTPAAAFAPRLPAKRHRPRPGLAPARTDTGRRALALPLSGKALEDAAAELAASLDGRQNPVTIVATGELAFPPFLLAEHLEQRGFDVLFQGTTRSPILPGKAITNSLDFPDEYGEGLENYLHNPPPPSRRAVIAYESPDHADSHTLREHLRAVAWVLPEGALTAASWRP